MPTELRVAVRSLLKNPGFAVVAVLTLALGIGAVTAVYSALSSVLLQPPPYPNAERLVVPFSVNPQRGIDIPRIGGADYLDWRREKVFDRIAITDHMGRAISLNDEAGEPEQVQVRLVSRDYFAVLGVPRALHGRIFNSEDYRLGHDGASCIIGHGLWQRRYRGDPRIVGRNIQVDGGPCAVVGVMAQGTLWPMEVDIVKPMPETYTDATATGERKGDFLIFGAIARLKPGSTLKQTNTVLAAVARRAEVDYPRERKGWTNQAVPLQEAMVGKNARISLLMSMAAVCCLLAIAVINVAGLLLTRAISRRQEIQVRAALGAGRWRLACHLLSESVVLALPGGVLGLMLAVGILNLLSTLSLPGVPPLPRVKIDAGMLAFVLGISMLTAVICGLTPLMHGSRRELNPTHSRISGGGMRALNGLIVVEITLSVLLLACAGLLIRSFMAIQRIDPGFQSEQLLTFAVNIPAELQRSAVSPQDPRQRTLSIYRSLVARMADAPGVLSVAVSSALPSGGGGEYFTTFYGIEGRAESPDGDNHPAFMAGDPIAQGKWYEASRGGADHPAMVNVVGAGFFDTLGVRRLAGRDFDSRDTFDSKPVIIVSETLARRAFPNDNPLGRRIRSDLDIMHGAGYREIVGVVGDVRYLGREDELRALAYVPHAQWLLPTMILNVRTVSKPSAMLAAIRSHVKKIHPEAVVSEAKTMTDILDRSVAPRRLGMTLFAILAGAAMLLAAIGLYGALSYTVAQRVKEIGIRMALGAQPSNLLGTVVGQGLKLTLLGVALGLSAAALFTRWMSHLLYEVSATDPTTFISIALLLTGVALTACYLPARRAVRVDPISALRAE